MSNRVVITGIGLVTPLGVGAKHCWSRLIAGNCGLVSTREFPDYLESGWDKIPAKVVGRVPRGSLSEGKFDVLDHMVTSHASRLALFSQYAMVAAAEALSDSRLVDESNPVSLLAKIDATRCGVAVGSGIGSLDDICTNSESFNSGGYRNVHPFMVPRLLVNMAAGNISIIWGIKGPLHAVLTACATGLQAIGDAYNFIKNDYADVMVCGGSEAPIHPVALAGFARARSVTTQYNDAPETASRPFDSKRSGFVLGEGSGIMILERLDHAIKRGVQLQDIYGEISGYGFCADAYHITAPREDGDGSYRSMKMALGRSGLKSNKISYINAHATSTVIGDRAEINGIKRLVDETVRSSLLTVTSTKSSIGHLLGAAGAVEAIFTAKTIQTGICPPTLNLVSAGGIDGDDASLFEAFNYAAGQHTSIHADHALCNLFGFGGMNSSLCISRYRG